jgi:glycerol dehydrogenase-like iron-containing ADH family enzyme
VSATDDAFTCHRDAVRAEQAMFDAMARHRAAEASGDAIGTMTAAADWQAAQLVNSTATQQLSAALSEFDAEIEAGL